MLKKVLVEMWDDLVLSFVEDKMTGSRLPSMLVVALAMISELAFGLIVILCLVKLWR